MRHIANAIIKTGGVDLAARILDVLLSCEDDERLTDCEAEAGQALFETICELCPESVGHCQNVIQKIGGIQETIKHYMHGKHEPTEHDLRCFVGMLETGEATFEDFATVEPLLANEIKAFQLNPNLCKEPA